MNYFTDILRLLNNFSRQIYGSDLVFIANQGFYIQNYSDNTLTYISLDGATTLFDLPKDTPIYPLNSEKSIAELSRNVVATLPLNGRNIGATGAESWRFVAADLTLSHEQQRIATKYDIQDISERFENIFIKQILQEIRKLTIEAIEKAIRNKKSKKEILLLWQSVEPLAEKNDFLGLEDVRDKLLRLSGKQKRGENASLIREAKKEIRQEVQQLVRQIKIWSVVIIFFGLIAMITLSSFRSKSTAQITNPVKIEQTLDAEPLSEQIILQAIAEYNKDKSRQEQITEWRSQKIVECLKGKAITYSALVDSIKSFANINNKFWQNCKN